MRRRILLLGAAIGLACFAHAHPTSLEEVLSGRHVALAVATWGGPCRADGGCDVGRCVGWTPPGLIAHPDLHRTCEISCATSVIALPDSSRCPAGTRCLTDRTDLGVSFVCVPDDLRWKTHPRDAG